MADLSKITDTIIGSEDWYIGLTSRIMDVCEKIINRPLTAQQQIDLGYEIYYCVGELHDNFSKINPDKEKIKNLLNKLQEDLNNL